MRTIPKRLQNSYFQLFNSRLISKNQYDLEAISHFEALLNASLPTTDYENSIYYFIKEMYYDDRNKFLNFIQNSNLQPFILYTNNSNIISHFNLQYKIYITWDKKNKKYKVEKFNNNKLKKPINSISSSSSSNSFLSDNSSDTSSDTSLSNNSSNKNFIPNSKLELELNLNI